MRIIKNGHFHLLIFSIALAILFIAVAGTGCSNDANLAYKDIDWELTLIGDDEIVLNFHEILDMPSCSGTSGFFTSVGIVNGPFDIKGVPLLDLCELIGGVEPSEYVRVSAIDHYSMVFSYNELHGEFTTYDTSLHEVSSEGLVLALMYELDGEPLSEDLGSPLRVAIVGDNILTEGHYWVKWIDSIEILNFD